MKRVFFFFLFVVIAVSASAQFRVEAGVSFGGYSKKENISAGAGFFANGLYDFCILSDPGVSIDFETGAGYFMNNLKYGDVAATMISNWITVPALLASDLHIGNASFRTAAGVYYAHAINGKIKSADGTNLEVISNKDNSANILKKNDFGIQAKIGFSFDFGLGLFVGANLGLINLSTIPDTDNKSNVFEVGLTYSFLQLYEFSQLKKFL